MKQDQPVTIVVPTHNRGGYMRRLLAFLADRQVAIPVIVADSSDPPCRLENQRAVQAVAGRLDITLNHYQLGLEAKTASVLSTLKTPLCVFCADDDFLISEGVDRCAKFLIDNPEFSLAQGVSSLVNTTEPTETTVVVLKSRTVAVPDPGERLRQHVQHFQTTFYGVHRREQLLANLELVHARMEYPACAACGEYLLSYLTALQGKLMKIESPFMVRQQHASAESLCMTQRVDWRNARKYAGVLQYCLAQELARATGQPLSRACREVRRMEGIRDCEIVYHRARTSRWPAPSVWQKIDREILRLLTQINGVLHRRPFYVGRDLTRDTQQPVPWQSLDFRRAFELIAQYPQGMSAEAFHNRLGQRQAA